MASERFWHMTYAEFYEEYKGFIRREKKNENRTRAAAWWVERFRRDPDPLKNLSEYLIGEDNEPKKQTDKMTDMQMFNMIRALNAALGGKEVVTDPCQT